MRRQLINFSANLICCMLQNVWDYPALVCAVSVILGNLLFLMCSTLLENLLTLFVVGYHWLSLDLCIIHRWIKYLQNIMCYFDGNMLLKTVFMYAGPK